MNIKDVSEYIALNLPPTILLSGKTSTGKSTLANELKDSFGYQVVELDEIVISSVVNNNKSVDEGHIFFEVYGNRNRLDWIETFVSSTKKRINDLYSAGLNSIIDGAVANPETLKEILDGTNYVIIYLHPQSTDNYIRNLTSRFLTATRENNAGLPVKFWNKIPRDDFTEFLDTRQLNPAINEAIIAYAKESQIESTKRLEMFKVHFDDILVVSI